MPTPDQLSQAGLLKLWPHRLALGRPVVRNVYVSIQAEKWIIDNVKNAVSDGVFSGVEAPREQLADIFRRVLTGERIDKFRPKTLCEHPDWIHELRTADLRIFGWFWRTTHFIVSSVEFKHRLSSKEVTYEGHIEG